MALGLKTQQAVTILSGISAGDRLAGDNLDKLHDGDKVKILEQNRRHATGGRLQRYRVAVLASSAMKQALFAALLCR